VFYLAHWLKTPEQHYAMLLSHSSEQRRERLFTPQKFPGVLPGALAEDPGTALLPAAFPFIRAAT
jgi:hypothetical protein